MSISHLLPILDNISPYKQYGKVTQVVGLMIESQGPQASVGDLCSITLGHGQKRRILAEVVGFREQNVLLMPYDRVEDISPGSLVESMNHALQVKVGTSMIGSVVDGLGRPIDESFFTEGLQKVPTDNTPPNPLKRPRIQEPLSLGVKAVDSLFSVGKGQRLGIFAGSGVGKSTLMAMIAKNSEADLNVIALIGERGREVRDFIERDLGEAGLSNTIVVVATSDQPALMRIKGAMTATAISEYFRDQGLNVTLMMDSVTRVAMAQREVGLAIGEPPTTKGYTPSVFALLPRLLERSGMSEQGSITAFYTVLVDGDDMNEPIADSVRGILDGHLVLDRRLANKGHFPAINVLTSISRVMNDLVSDDHRATADYMRHMLSVYSESEDLINIGAYKKGTNKEVDVAIAKYPEIMSFLKQGLHDSHDFKETAASMIQQFGIGGK
ncbi:flagellar protein export ATPase FliI [Salipaludibacillus agaradhaerens]|uniref:Flagellar protein export ATPase FliI n=1 Tax=Salipaludibacillus agaradhaerens TaxID=76935 RepID=A0A9Q4B106_SALAG|nr:flagellar protein export ATPase FliI [Salipaludibacillus agaradhaerens]MCR6096042.1 flagellar protein export ATPase FliI [Salipaludibacillus agaradhaerens]MCR6114399.1 flagellar protein export ATPase FliI [Salipaludibacillus agaradhaerens]